MEIEDEKKKNDTSKNNQIANSNIFDDRKPMRIDKKPLSKKTLNKS